MVDLVIFVPGGLGPGSGSVGEGPRGQDLAWVTRFHFCEFWRKNEPIRFFLWLFREKWLKPLFAGKLGTWAKMTALGANLLKWDFAFLRGFWSFLTKIGQKWPKCARGNGVFYGLVLTGNDGPFPRGMSVQYGDRSFLDFGDDPRPPTGEKVGCHDSSDYWVRQRPSLLWGKSRAGFDEIGPDPETGCPGGLRKKMAFLRPETASLVRQGRFLTQKSPKGSFLARWQVFSSQTLEKVSKKDQK